MYACTRACANAAYLVFSSTYSYPCAVDGCTRIWLGPNTPVLIYLFCAVECECVCVCFFFPFDVFFHHFFFSRMSLLLPVVSSMLAVVFYLLSVFVVWWGTRACALHIRSLWMSGAELTGENSDNTHYAPFSAATREVAKTHFCLPCIWMQLRTRIWAARCNAIAYTLFSHFVFRFELLMLCFESVMSITLSKCVAGEKWRTEVFF